MTIEEAILYWEEHKNIFTETKKITGYYSPRERAYKEALSLSIWALKMVKENLLQYRLSPELVKKMTDNMLNSIPNNYAHALTDAPKPREYKGGIENVWF